MLCVGELLESVSQGGPTASAGFASHLAWWSDHVGLAIPLEHRIIQPLKKSGSATVKRRGDPLEPWQLFNLVHYADMYNDPFGILARFLVFALVLCIRFKHLERASLPECKDKRIYTTISRGKRSVGGLSPVFFCVHPGITPRRRLVRRSSVRGARRPEREGGQARHFTRSYSCRWGKLEEFLKKGGPVLRPKGPGPRESIAT